MGRTDGQTPDSFTEPARHTARAAPTRVMMVIKANAICGRFFQTGLSHATANGFMPILELLADIDDVDPNLADNDGNTPLIFAAQAGN